MDTNTLFTKLKELGQENTKPQELKDFCLQHFKQIEKLLPQRILNNDGPVVLDCLINGLPDHSFQQNSFKSKVIDIALKSIRNEMTSTAHCNDVISKISLKFYRCPADDLVRWSSDCVQSIIEDNDVNMIWRDLLPECLNSLLSYDTVRHGNVDMTSEEYKEQCVTALCQCRWKEQQLVQLTDMFNKMHLSPNDHKQVVNKICTYLNDIPPESVPPLLLQLLKLCNTLNIDIVLIYLSEYFKVNLYSKLEPPTGDSESATIDLDDVARYTDKELSECLSTCLYHLTQAVHQDLLKKTLKRWPKSQLLRNPLLIDIALAVSGTIPDVESSCIAIIKNAIQQRELDGIMALESAWLREVLPPDVDVASVLKVLTTESVTYCKSTMIGLIELAFALLATPKTKPFADICWSHGRLILVRICKVKPASMTHVLMQLADKDIILRQYSDCFYLLCKLIPVTVERCSHISTFLEDIQPQNNEYRHIARIYQAMHPLLNFTIKVRDIMVILCRKLLYSNYRCLAMSGFLVLLRYIKISNMSYKTQCQLDQSTDRSYLSQVTFEVHATQNGNPAGSAFRNETVLFEVLSIINRCLAQDAAVKQLIYTDMYKCVNTKPTLHQPVLEMYYHHISKYISEDDDGSPPVQWDKCVQIKKNTATLIEPIGYLIYSISQFLDAEDDEADDLMSSQFAPDYIEAKMTTKLINILDNLVKRDLLIDTALESDQISLAAVTPESKAKYLKLQQILQCYEALIAYKILLWTPSSTNTHEIVLQLYNSYNKLLELIKVPKSKKTLKPTQSDVSRKSTQKSQSSSKNGSETTIKSTNKDKMAPFKPLPCLWDLEFCSRIIELLYSEQVSWCIPEHRNVIRTRREFHIFALGRVQTVLNDEILEKADVITHGIKITQTLFKHCLVSFQDICTFDEKTALASIELLNNFINLLLSKNYAFKADKVLSHITGGNALSECIATVLKAAHAAIKSLETGDTQSNEVNAGSRKLYVTLCNLAARVMTIQLDVTCPKLTSIITEYDTYIRKTHNDITTLLPALLYVSTRDNQGSELIENLLATLGSVLGIIMEETQIEEEDRAFPSLDERTGHVVLSELLTHMSIIHKSIKLQLTHTKQKQAALNATTITTRHQIEKDLKRFKSSLVVQLCQLTNWTRAMAELRCTIGIGSDKVLLAFIQLYMLLGEFVKLLSLNVTPEDITLLHNIRFKRLMLLSGKELSTTMDNLIDYLSQSNAKDSDKVLKETKHIPRLVLEAEQFTKMVVLLAKKTKVNYEQYMPVGNARDFRILRSSLPTHMDNALKEIQDADTVILSPRSERSDDEHDENEDEPSPKRRRV